MVASRVLWLKRNRTSAALGWALCSLLWCTAPLCAAAQSDSLIVLDAGGAGHAPFLAAVRIQLGATYEVRELSPSLPGPLPQRIAAATALAVGEHALAAVWVEQAAGAHGVRSAVLYVVGQREDRALLEVVQVPSARGPDLPRVLALKLGELLSELRVADVQPLAPRTTPASAVVSATPPPLPAAAAVQPATTEGSEPEPTNGRFWAAGRAGLRLDFGVGTSSSRAGLGAELTPEWTSGRLRLALGVGAAWFPALNEDSAYGSVQLREVAPRVLAAAAWRTSLCDLGVHTAGVLSLISARGRTPAGLIGDSRRNVLGWAFGVHAERSLWGPLGVVLFIEAEPQRERVDFLVNGETVLDRGRVRVVWGIDLRLRTALTPATGKERALPARSP